MSNLIPISSGISWPDVDSSGDGTTVLTLLKEDGNPVLSEAAAYLLKEGS